MRRHLTIETLRERIAAPATVLLAAVLFVTQPATASQPSETQLASYESGSETERVKLLLHLAKNGKHDQAEWLLQHYPLQGPHAANRMLYLDGLILKARRDYTGAVEKFRSALADDPKLTMVRAELAQTLVILEEDDSATHHLRLLAADAPTEAEALSVKSFIDQVDARSPLKYNAWISAAPTSNINNGTSNKKVYDAFNHEWVTGEDYQEKRAFGATMGFNAGFNKRLSNDFSFVAGVGGELRLYNLSDFNALSFSESMEVRRLFERGHLGLGLVASQSVDMESRDISYKSYGPRAALKYTLNKNNTLNISGIFELRDSVNDNGDGTALMLDASLDHSFSSSFSTTLLGGYDRVKTQIAYNSYQTWLGGVSFYKELPMGITADVGAQIRYSEFDAPQGIFGLREDWRTTGNLALTKRDLNILGFAPSLNYSYSYNESTIGLYDFDNHSVDLRFTKDF